MRYLRKFNENSHGYGDKDLHAKIQEHPGYHDARLANPHASDEEIAAMLGHYSVEPEKRPGYMPEEPETECEPCGDEDDAEGHEGHEASEEDNVPKKPGFGSRIKSFLGFGK